MTSREIRQKFLEFFEKRGHKIIPPSPLVLANDPTTLFTSSGMQPLVPYLLGEPHPSGSKRLADSQPSIRVSDIEEVGDNRHDTFFEMLGNWSLGDYFKAEQLPWVFEFLTKELGFSKNNLWVSVFKGDKATSVPRDEESFAIWKKLGIPEERIFFYGVKNNWWSRSGEPKSMPLGEIGGPDSEVFFEFTDVPHDPKYGLSCHPNCDCGRFLEIGNSVFIQYQKQADGSLKELPQKNVDFGGGLERITAAVNHTPDIFQTDLFWPIIKKLEQISGKIYGKDVLETRAMRLISDHLKAAAMIAHSGVFPSNKTQGYILRRLLRRALLALKKLDLSMTSFPFEEIIGEVAAIYNDVFPELGITAKEIAQVFSEEAGRFEKALSQGIKELGKSAEIDARTAFYVFETFGLPYEVIEEIAKARGQKIEKLEFEEELEKHQQLSKGASEHVFRGGLADQSYEVTKYHTATHILHQALRLVLGESVRQEGSNITAKRLRFDFSHHQKLTSEQIKQIEELVNQKIQENLPVVCEIIDRDLAFKMGALGFFREKYGDKVKVYSISDPSTRSSTEAHSKSSGPPFSREICGGPHVKETGELGRFKIVKEEAVSAGVRRIKAILAPI
ncbi:MAG: alanine--tRNA ligase [bacterium]|nr:alanine--tRNA ligase [bacterium]